jgi:hypothetical protein
MKIKTAIALTAASALLGSMLAGCEDRKMGEEVRSVDWYEANKVERIAKLTECMSHPDKLDATPNCINASHAENNTKAGTKWGTESEGVRTPASIYD